MTTLETVVCDLCGSTNAQPYLCVRDYIYGLPGEFQLVRCQTCGLLYLNPRPDRASIGTFYPNLDYHAFRPASGLKAKILDRLRHNEAKSLLTGVPANPRVLEIGCATGDMLIRLRALGADVMGIEPNGAAVAVAREQHKLNVEMGMLDDVQLAPSQFDLILMKYALEHVHSPRSNLITISRLLKPGGQAVFWVPNADSLDARLFGRFWRGLDAPRHLYIFTPKTLSGLLACAGMCIHNLSYSSVPNDWAGSTEFWLEAHRMPHRLAHWFGVESAPALVAWLPISTAAAAFKASGRIKITAIRQS